MSSAMRKALVDALSLSPRERLELVTELLDSVEGQTDPEWDAAWNMEIAARLRAAEGRSERGGRWTDVQSRIRMRFSAKRAVTGYFSPRW